MDNQSWDRAKLADWKVFWESEVGQEYLAKLEEVKQMIFVNIMNNSDKEALANLAGRAAGIEIIIQDIRQGMLTANEDEKEDEKKAKNSK